jgi:hypothetical protein
LSSEGAGDEDAFGRGRRCGGQGSRRNLRRLIPFLDRAQFGFVGRALNEGRRRVAACPSGAGNDRIGEWRPASRRVARTVMDGQRDQFGTGDSE